MKFARRIRQRPSYANVMATIAVFIALGGGAYAISTKAPPDSVNSKAIIDGSVKSADVKDNSLTGADIDQSALSGGGGPPSGPAGGDLAGNYPKPQIAPGAVGQNALNDGSVTASKLDGGAVTASKLGDAQVFVTAGTIQNASQVFEATCPGNARLLTGGAETDGDARLTNSYPSTASQSSPPPQGGITGVPDRWIASGEPNGTRTFSGIYVFAVCLK